jgi:hypothetical protein
MSRRYSKTQDPQLNDFALIWDESESDWRLTTFSNILALFDSTLTSAVVEPDSQYASPASTGFSVAISDNDNDTHLILTPANTLAAGTIVLSATLRDKQLLIVSCSQQVTTLTIDGNGATSVNGAPTSLGANDFFTLKYDLVMKAWNRVG